MQKYWLLWHFEKVFHSWHGQKLIKTPKFLHFSDKQCPFTQNFAKQPNIFLFPKFLELFFTPKNTPPKVKNSKPFWITIFFGHPVDHSDLGKLLSKIDLTELLEYEWKNNLRMVRIYFDTPTFDRITKDRAAKFVDMLSAIGGTMGLLTGFSLISAVEIIYFCFKILFNYRKINWMFNECWLIIFKS